MRTKFFGLDKFSLRFGILHEGKLSLPCKTEGGRLYVQIFFLVGIEEHTSKTTRRQGILL